MAERARVRTVAEAKRAAAPPSLADVQASLNPSDAIVALNQFEDELAIWVIRAEFGDRHHTAARPSRGGSPRRPASG